MQAKGEDEDEAAAEEQIETRTGLHIDGDEGQDVDNHAGEQREAVVEQGAHEREIDIRGHIVLRPLVGPHDLPSRRGWT